MRRQESKRRGRRLTKWALAEGEEEDGPEPEEHRSTETKAGRGGRGQDPPRRLEIHFERPESHKIHIPPHRETIWAVS